MCALRVGARHTKKDNDTNFGILHRTRWGGGSPPPRRLGLPKKVKRLEGEVQRCVRESAAPHESHLMWIKPPLTLQALLGDIIDILQELCFY